MGIKERILKGDIVSKKEMSLLDTDDLVDLLYEYTTKEVIIKNKHIANNLSLDDVLEGSSIRLFDNPDELIVFHSIGGSEPHLDGRVLSIDITPEELEKLLNYAEYDNDCPMRKNFIRNCPKERIKVSHHKIDLDK